MAYVEKENPLWSLLSEIAEAEGTELYDAEVLNPASVRLAIQLKAGSRSKTAEAGDVPEPAERKNVSSGDCSRVCRRLMVVFQAEGKKYGLLSEPEIDVSSPGINRQLRLPEHFRQAVGERVKIVLNTDCAAENGKRMSTLLGRMDSCDGEHLTVLDESRGECFQLQMSDIKRANVEFKF
jgi:ribosome maturation factor RimP